MVDEMIAAAARSESQCVRRMRTPQMIRQPRADLATATWASVADAVRQNAEEAHMNARNVLLAAVVLALCEACSAARPAAEGRRRFLLGPQCLRRRKPSEPPRSAQSGSGRAADHHQGDRCISRR